MLKFSTTVGGAEVVHCRHRPLPMQLSISDTDILERLLRWLLHIAVVIGEHLHTIWEPHW